MNFFIRNFLQNCNFLLAVRRLPSCCYNFNWVIILQLIKHITINIWLKVLTGCVFQGPRKYGFSENWKIDIIFTLRIAIVLLVFRPKRAQSCWCNPLIAFWLLFCWKFQHFTTFRTVKNKVTKNREILRLLF